MTKISGPLEPSPGGAPVRPGEVPSGKLPVGEKEVTVRKGFAEKPVPSPSAEEKPPLAAHEHIFSQLRAVFDERIKGEEEKGREKILEDYHNIEAYLRKNMAGLIEEAEKTSVHGVTASKSETGLPYTLRCFKKPESEDVEIHISFGTFREGGETKIKDLLILGEGGPQQKVQRSPMPVIGGEEIAEQKRVRVQAILKHLIGAKVSGLAIPGPLVYRGKGGVVKKKEIMERYTADLYEFIQSLTSGDVHEKLDIKIDISKKLIHTIAEMHKARIIHLDIKTGNILLDQDLSPWLGDFGLAVYKGETIPTRGGPGYIAPELIEYGSLEASEKQDLWSLGAVLAELIFGFNFRVDQAAIFGLSLEKEEREELSEEETAKRYDSFCEAVESVRNKLLEVHDGTIEVLAKLIANLLSLDPDERMTSEQLADKVDRLPPNQS